jgi:DNA repair exonuclease SbcCD ATPase subunit/DNA repair exonuclease SbcCD nuclease subunit
MKPIKLIFHLADIHIRSNNEHKSRFNEYFSFFNKTIDSIKSKYIKDHSIVIICGDIFHDKYTLTNSAIILFNHLIKSLAEFIPVILISGNHDFLSQSNDKNNDLISSLLKNPIDNVYHYDKSGDYYMNNIHFGITTIQDFLQYGSSSEKNINLPEFPKPDNSYEYNIALAHCSNIPIHYFKNYKYILLGDTHQKTIFKENDIIYAYPGSLLQQNFGEPILNHGYILWDLESNTQNHIHIHNDYALAYLKLIKNEYHINYSDDNSYIPLNDFFKYENKPKYIQIKANCVFDDTLNDLFNKHNIISHIDFYSNKNNTEFNQIECNQFNSKEYYTKYISENVNNQWNTNDLINFKLNYNNLPDVIQNKINEVNNKFNLLIKKNPIDYENKNINHFKINKLEWNWILPFGSNNVFTFNNKNSTTVLNAPNGFGKSAFLDVILLALYNTPTPSRYNRYCGVSIICDSKPKKTEAATIHMSFSINNNNYTIFRKFSSKITQDIPDIQNKESKLYHEENLIKSGHTAIKQWINDNLCSLDDFILATMITQNKDNDFFNMDNKNQIELLDNYLHMQYFNNISSVLSSNVKNINNLIDHITTYINSIKPECDDVNELIEEYEMKKELYDSLLIKPEKYENTIKPEESCEELNRLKILFSYIDLPHIKNKTYDIPDTIGFVCRDQPIDDNFEHDVNELLKEYEEKQQKFTENVKNKKIVKYTLEDYEKFIKEYDIFNENFKHKEIINGEYSLNRKHVIENEINNIIKRHPDIIPKKFNVPEINFHSNVKLNINENTTPKKLNENIEIVNDMKNLLHDLENEKEELLMNKPIEESFFTQNDIDNLKNNLNIDFDIIDIKNDKINIKFGKIKDKNKLKSWKQSLQFILNAKKYLKTHDNNWEYNFNEICEKIKKVKQDLETVEIVVYNTHHYLKSSNLYYELQKELDLISLYIDCEKKNTFEENLIKWKKIKIEIEESDNTIKYMNEINKLKNIIYHSFKYQKQCNTKVMYDDYVEKLKYYHNLKYELKSFLENYDIHSIQKYNEEKNNLYNLLNDLQNIKDLHQNISANTNNFKLWLYDNHILPMLINQTNIIVNSIFNDRSMSLNYKYKNKNNTIIWYVVDQNNTVYIDKLSGAQSFAFSLAFKLAINSIGLTSMKSSQLFIDEGFCSFDEINLQSVPTLIHGLKSLYDEVILVSHIDVIKNCGDYYCKIERNNGISKIIYSNN